jgi:hypothetical protein
MPLQVRLNFKDRNYERILKILTESNLIFLPSVIVNFLQCPVDTRGVRPINIWEKGYLHAVTSDCT